MLNWWYAVPFGSAAVGAILVMWGLWLIPTYWEPNRDGSAKCGQWIPPALVIPGLLFLAAALPLLWLPIWYGG